MVVRDEVQAPNPTMQEDEFMMSGTLGSNIKEKRRRGSSSRHRYKTLRAKVEDVVGASSQLDAADISPISVAVVASLGRTDVDKRSNEDPERLDVVFEDSRSGERDEPPREKLKEQDDLTDPAEWRKFIESVKKEVAGCPPSPYPSQQGSNGSREEETEQSIHDYRPPRSRTPISLRRLFPFVKGDRRGEEDVAIERPEHRTRSPTRRSRSPIKRSLSPIKFRRRSDPPSSEICNLIASNSSKSRGSFRLPRIPSPVRMSPYSQLSKPAPSNEAYSEDIGTNDTPCTIIPDMPQDFVKPEMPTQPKTHLHPQDVTTKAVSVESTKRKVKRKSRKKSSRSPPTTKPIPPEIQELNDQVIEAVGSGFHEDDDTAGEVTPETDRCNQGVSTVESDDLLSNINISTTSGIQVKREEEKEEMIHQTIARRVLSVLIRPSPQMNETLAPENDVVNSAMLKSPVTTPSDDDYNDAPDSTNADSARLSDAVTSKASTDKIREKLKALKAKKDHVALKKKAEKSRKKLEKSEKTKKSKSKKVVTGKRPARSEKDLSTTSYESFDSFSSKTGGNCFTTTFCCMDSKYSVEEETRTTLTREDSTGLYSDISIDTYESEWVGRPLPILSPSDLSAERDDLFDVVEKCVCGTR